MTKLRGYAHKFLKWKRLKLMAEFPQLCSEGLDLLEVC